MRFFPLLLLACGFGSASSATLVSTSTCDESRGECIFDGTKTAAVLNTFMSGPDSFYIEDASDGTLMFTGHVTPGSSMSTFAGRVSIPGPNCWAAAECQSVFDSDTLTARISCKAACNSNVYPIVGVYNVTLYPQP